MLAQQLGKPTCDYQGADLGTVGRGIEIVEWDSSGSSSDQNSGSSSSVNLTQLMRGHLARTSNAEEANGDP